jgi:hypothetical protein
VSVSNGFVASNTDASRDVDCASNLADDHDDLVQPDLDLDNGDCADLDACTAHGTELSDELNEDVDVDLDEVQGIDLNLELGGQADECVDLERDDLVDIKGQGALGSAFSKGKVDVGNNVSKFDEDLGGRLEFNADSFLNLDSE